MNFSRFGIHFSLVLLLLSFSGCVMLGPDFESPETKLPENWNKEGNALFKERLEKENIEWWKLFEDPVLDNLVQTAYNQNLPLRTAGLRILEARAQLGLIMHQFEAGVVTELDVHQAKTLLSATLATIPSLQSSLQQNKNALAILLGTLPEDLKGSLDGAAYYHLSGCGAQCGAGSWR